MIDTLFLFAFLGFLVPILYKIILKFVDLARLDSGTIKQVATCYAPRRRRLP